MRAPGGAMAMEKANDLESARGYSMEEDVASEGVWVRQHHPSDDGGFGPWRHHSLRIDSLLPRLVG